MAFYHRNSERKRIPQDYRRQEEDVVTSLCRLSSRPTSPTSLLEQDKRIRREIANSNERRRMQSINAGFESLRALLPHREGEKLSKAGILQSTADYVYQLEQDKARLQQRNSQFSKRVLKSSHSNQDSDGSCSDSPKPKRKKREPADCVDEGIGSSSPARSDNGLDDVKREILDLRLQLKHERTLRLLLEEQVRNFEARLYPAGNGPDSVKQIHKNMKSFLNSGHESVFGSPRSQMSNQDVEIPHEIFLQESTLEHSNTKNPKKLSEKTNLLHCVDDLSLSDAIHIPRLLISSNHLNVSPSFPIEISINPDKAASYKVSTSRQNLETIVEAIRHVEGDHLFGDETVKSEATRPIKDEKLYVTKQQYAEQSLVHSLPIRHVEGDRMLRDEMTKSEETKPIQDEKLCVIKQQYTEQSLVHKGQDLTFQCQRIKNVPLKQSRPGVIVSNVS